MKTVYFSDRQAIYSDFHRWRNERKIEGSSIAPSADNFLVYLLGRLPELDKPIKELATRLKENTNETKD